MCDKLKEKITFHKLNHAGKKSLNQFPGNVNLNIASKRRKTNGPGEGVLSDLYSESRDRG